MGSTLRALVLGLAVATVGMLLIGVPGIQAVEEGVGLTWLFRLRGPRPPPPEVVIVAIDEISSSVLGVPTDPRKWPRTFHAQLVDRLAELGATSVAFDIHFSEAKSPAEDQRLAASLAASGRVVLFEYLKVDRPYAADAERSGLADTVHIERLIPPIPVLSEAAFALAPFPLPKVPASVSQAWIFKDGAGGVPTLPGVAFQLHTEASQRRFCALVLDQDPTSYVCRRLLATGGPVTPETAMALRELFSTRPELATQVQVRAGQEPESIKRELRRLLRYYSGPSHFYLDFYGPANTITTVPYHRVLRPSTDLRPVIDGATVFVGFSEQFKPEKRDGFFTVYSTADGIDVSGVEIAATTFGNLLEGRHVQVLRLGTQSLIVAGWGLLIGVLLVSVPGLGAIATALGLAALWLGLAVVLFSGQGLWFPLAVPLLFQLPLALTAALLWRYLCAKSDRKRIREVFQNYVPLQVVDDLVTGGTGIAQQVQSVYGVCLSTDVDQFTKTAERLSPGDLRELLNHYFQAVFRPIKQSGGAVLDVVGDAIMAVWTAGPVDRPATRRDACLAALGIQQVVTEFNRCHPESPLPTRIGLHSGIIALGNVGGEGHFEYRPVGDIVNASSRIEGLNKHLGTRVLASEVVVDRVPGLVTRNLGRFRVAGKDRPLAVYELLGREGEVPPDRVRLCRDFEQALGLFGAQCWDEAEDSLRALLGRYGEDGPSRYYLQLGRRFRREFAQLSWDGVVNMSSK